MLQQDIEGQTMKVDALNKHLSLGEDNDGSPSSSELPAQRTVGLTFVEQDRAGQLVVDTQNALTLLSSTENAGANGGIADETVFLEDISHAIRPDVKRDERDFRSLCGREVHFRVGGGVVRPAAFRALYNNT